MFQQFQLTDAKYLSRYHRVINTCRQMDLSNCYTEKHHIVPRSLGGDNSCDNLVALSARAHWLCHWILARMFVRGTTERKKMANAFWNMCGRSSKQFRGSRIYEKARSEFAIYNSQLRLGIFKHSDEAKQKISQALLGRPQNDDHIKARFKSRQGWKHSDEAKQKLSEANLGKKLTIETREKISKALTGRKMDPKAVAKSAANRTGLKRSKETISNLEAAHRRRMIPSKIQYIDHNGCIFFFEYKIDLWKHINNNGDPRITNNQRKYRSNFYSQCLNNKSKEWVSYI